MFECPVCGQRSVGWSADFDYEDYGIERVGIVHTYNFSNRGAYIEAYEDCEPEKDDSAV